MNFNWPDWAAAYWKVSIYGNDANDGKTLPFRTLQKVIDVGGVAAYILLDNITIINEYIGYSSVIIKSINNGIINGTFVTRFINNSSSGRIPNITGVKLINVVIYQKNTFYPAIFYNCFIKGGNINFFTGNFNIFSHFSGWISSRGGASIYAQNFTFYKSIISYYDVGINSTAHIFHSSNVFIYDMPISYSIFYNCLIKIGAETSYTALTGATEDELRQNLEDRFAAQYPTSVNGDFSTCRFVDPKFNNPDLDDFTLAPDSPARTMSYFGTFIGAKDVGYPINIYANDLGHPLAFYNASAINLDIADNSLKLTLDANGDAVGDGEIYTKPIDLEKTNQLIAPNLSFEDAVRNQETVDSALDYDIDHSISPSTDTVATLTAGELYYVTGGSIVLHLDDTDTEGTTYIIYEKIVVPADATGPYFTNPDTTTSPLLYHITNVRVGKTVKFRFKNSLSGTTVDNTGTLTAGTWYRVKGTAEDSITWNGLTVPVGDSFLATDTANTFTGTPVCEEMFTSSEAWCEVIVNSPIKCKRVGDVYSGAIDVGSDGNLLTNGNPDYFNDANYARPEFDVYGQFIQYYVKVITNNMHV